ncbi:MAG TPA: hypothetical protein PLS29_02910 [Acidimicrobiales bacterium]|nr:hypothetical protein [Acidimicrobiales bacterium]
MTTWKRLGRTAAMAALAGAMAAPLAVGTAGAAPSAAFCAALLHGPKAAPPSTKNLNAYKAWVKAEMPYFQKLAAEAPDTASKKLFNLFVTSLKHEASSTSAKTLAAYWVAHDSQWAKVIKTVAKDSLACVERLS